MLSVLAITWTPIIVAAVLLAAGMTLLLFTERFQARLLKWHDDLRDAPTTPQFLLHLSGRHYEVPMRLTGTLLVLAALLALIVTVIQDNLPS